MATSVGHIPSPNAGAPRAEGRSGNREWEYGQYVPLYLSAYYHQNNIPPFLEPS